MKFKTPGVKPKYKEGIETVKIHPLIPKKRKAECLIAIEKIVEKEKR